MVKDAEQKQAELEDFNEVRGPVFKIKNDPRITTIGKIPAVLIGSGAK
jgi:hypothetical protein